jgi:hypothetical protein
MKQMGTWLLGALIAAVAAEMLLWFQGRVPVTNQAWRILAGAPAVHARGHLLMYSGAVPVTDQGIVPLAVSNEGLALYKAKGTPDWYAWVFVPRTGGRPAWRYRWPRPPRSGSFP